MADRTANVRLTIDHSNLSAGAKKAANDLKGVGTAGHVMAGAVSGALGRLSGLIGGEVGAVLSEVSSGLDGIGEHASSMSRKLQTAGAVGLAAGTSLLFIGAKDKQAQDQLAQAISNTGGSISDYQDQIDEAIKTQEKFGHSAVDTQSALQKMTQASGSTDTALKNMAVVTDLAAAKHISLADAADMVDRVLAGKGGRTLAQFGITMQAAVNPAKDLATATRAHAAALTGLSKAQDQVNLFEAKHVHDAKISQTTIAQSAIVYGKLEDAQKKVASTQAAVTAAQKEGKNATDRGKVALDQLAQKLNGQAAAAADNFGGHIRALQAKIEDSVAQFGQKYGPAITAAGAALGILGTVLDLVKARQLASAAAAQVAAAATTELTVAEDGLNASLFANPIGLVVLAIAALVGGLILAYNKVGWFHTFVDWAFHSIATLVGDVVGFIKGHWQLLLAILIGPIAFAIPWIKDHWSGIVTVFSNVVNAIKKVIGAVTEVLTAPFRLAVATIQTIMGPILAIIDKVTGFLNSKPLTAAQQKTFTETHTGTGAGYHRAAGGPVMAGFAYTVGERGQETFIPSTNGMIVPHGSGGGGPTINFYGPIIGGTRASMKALTESIWTEFQSKALREKKRNGFSPLIGQTA